MKSAKTQQKLCEYHVFSRVQNAMEADAPSTKDRSCITLVGHIVTHSTILVAHLIHKRNTVGNSSITRGKQNSITRRQ